MSDPRGRDCFSPVGRCVPQALRGCPRVLLSDPRGRDCFSPAGRCVPRVTAEPPSGAFRIRRAHYPAAGSTATRRGSRIPKTSAAHSHSILIPGEASSRIDTTRIAADQQACGLVDPLGRRSGDSHANGTPAGNRSNFAGRPARRDRVASMQLYPPRRSRRHAPVAGALHRSGKQTPDSCAQAASSSGHRPLGGRRCSRKSLFADRAATAVLWRGHQSLFRSCLLL